ncbi:unnamed protein product [Sphagnum jensenii]|uniref:Uncharacterized protein n=1 Tax=Sphagnum jensenii TaxID=128206 RepID=A0ABP0VRA8_9BRYO
MAATDRATSSGLACKGTNDVHQEQASLFCSSDPGTFNDISVFQEGEDGSSRRADVPWGHKLQDTLRVVFSHEQSDGLLLIGKFVLNQLQCIRSNSHDRLQQQDAFADSHEPGQLESTKSSAARSDLMQFIEESPEVAEATVANSARELDETTNYKLERAPDQSMRAELLPRVSRSSARPSGTGVSPSPSQVCPFLPDVEAPIEPASCAGASPASAASNNPLTTIACGLLPSRLRRSKNRKMEVKAGDGKLQEVLTQVSSKANPLRILRKLLRPACAAASSNSTVAPKMMATENARKNIIELFSLKSQHQEEHFPNRGSCATRSIKLLAQNWPYRNAGGDADGSDPVLLKPRLLQPQSPSGMLEKDKENHSDRTCRDGQWIKTDSECPFSRLSLCFLCILL